MTIKHYKTSTPEEIEAAISDIINIAPEIIAPSHINLDSKDLELTLEHKSDAFLVINDGDNIASTFKAILDTPLNGKTALESSAILFKIIFNQEKPVDMSEISTLSDELNSLNDTDIIWGIGDLPANECQSYRIIAVISI